MWWYDKNDTTLSKWSSVECAVSEHAHNFYDSDGVRNILQEENTIWIYIKSFLHLHPQFLWPWRYFYCVSLVWKTGAPKTEKRKLFR